MSDVFREAEKRIEVFKEIEEIIHTQHLRTFLITIKQLLLNMTQQTWIEDTIQHIRMYRERARKIPVVLTVAQGVDTITIDEADIVFNQLICC